jgi:anti-anti-sigma regulatory factor
MTTAIMAEFVKLDQKNIVAVLKDTGKQLARAEGEVVVDFSAVEWVDSAIVKALQEFADTADLASVKVGLRDVNIGVYKVLKLVRLAERFSFAA